MATSDTIDDSNQTMNRIYVGAIGCLIVAVGLTAALRIGCDVRLKSVQAELRKDGYPLSQEDLDKRHPPAIPGDGSPLDRLASLAPESSYLYSTSAADPFTEAMALRDFNVVFVPANWRNHETNLDPFAGGSPPLAPWDLSEWKALLTDAPNTPDQRISLFLKSLHTQVAMEQPRIADLRAVDLTQPARHVGEARVEKLRLSVQLFRADAMSRAIRSPEEIEGIVRQQLELATTLAEAGYAEFAISEVGIACICLELAMLNHPMPASSAIRMDAMLEAFDSRIQNTEMVSKRAACARLCPLRTRTSCRGSLLSSAGALGACGSRRQGAAAQSLGRQPDPRRRHGDASRVAQLRCAFAAALYLRQRNATAHQMTPAS